MRKAALLALAAACIAVAGCGQAKKDSPTFSPPGNAVANAGADASGAIKAAGDSVATAPKTDMALCAKTKTDVQAAVAAADGVTSYDDAAPAADQVNVAVADINQLRDEATTASDLRRLTAASSALSNFAAALTALSTGDETTAMADANTGQVATGDVLGNVAIAICGGGPIG